MRHIAIASLLAVFAASCSRDFGSSGSTPGNGGGTSGNGGGAAGSGGSAGGGNAGGGGSAGGGMAGDGGTMGGGGTADGGEPSGLMTLAVFGDCRPPNLEGTSQYPSQIVSGIFTLAQSNGAQFVIGTGDYMFSNTVAGVAAQLQLFAKSKGMFTAGPVYLAMGNHECTGYTASNCPNLNETPNIQAFMSQLVPPGVTKPYYRFDVATPLGKAKFVVTAANAWDTTQESWLKTQLAEATPYTFVVRHEPAADTQAPGVSPSEAVILQFPFTLELNGHTHEYRHVDTQHVISGNAGAPLQSNSGSRYGFLMLRQQANGNINVTEIEEATGNTLDTWTVTPAGKSAP
jgi:hypothetical protein